MALTAGTVMNSARPPGRPVMPCSPVLRALVRVARRAVLAEWAALTDAVAALVDDDHVARFEIAHSDAAFFDDADELVPEDLRRFFERHQPALGIAVVIAVPAEDVEVRAAQADRADAQEHLGWPRWRHRDVAHAHVAGGHQHGGAH